jgi:hypothetical protein
VIRRRSIILPLIAATLTACGTEEPERRSEPHPPASADERLLASRYREFAEALERSDADGICGGLASRLARSYGCGEGAALRLPAELRGIAVSDDEIFAAADPGARDEIQISAPTTGRDGASLIVFFRRDGGRGWRIERAMLGGYG